MEQPTVAGWGSNRCYSRPQPCISGAATGTDLINVQPIDAIMEQLLCCIDSPWSTPFHYHGQYFEAPTKVKNLFTTSRFPGIHFLHLRICSLSNTSMISTTTPCFPWVETTPHHPNQNESRQRTTSRMRGRRNPRFSASFPVLHSSQNDIAWNRSRSKKPRLLTGTGSCAGTRVPS